MTQSPKDKSAQAEKPNHLINEKSPYLLQHAHNPVDWYPWGEVAFEKARKEGKPVFLSVGYSSCHWCHVMKRESFEDPEIARVLNENFVSVKVDREELPDVDALYMTAVQMMTGSGGWPMTVVMLPDGRPFFAGTYFPPADGPGRPGFKNIMLQLAEAYKTRRAEVEAVAARAEAALKHGEDSSGMAGRAGEPPLAALMEQLRRRFDEKNGGFGSRPKFPPHASFPALFEAARSGDKEAQRMAERTLEAMALGGIRDHVGGGFARYATDAAWFLPHFEKMLYDNGMLLRWYAEGFALTKNELFREAARGIVDWLAREMTHPEGGFYSALDAESEHEEGKFYVWSRDEIIKILGKDDGPLFCEIYGTTPEGNYREEATGEATGRNILFLKRTLAEEARARKMEPAALEKRMTGARAKLLAERQKRVPPGLDDKILVSWNGLAIGGMAHAGKTLGEPTYVASAEKAARFILTKMRGGDGRLLRRWRQGEARIPAYLEDYAYFTDALLDLHEATGKAEWLQEARAAAKIMTEDFWDVKDGGFYTSSARHGALLLRMKEPADGATPSANGIAARALLRLHAATGEAQWLDYGSKTLDAFALGAEQAPQAFTTLAMAAALLPQASATTEGMKPDAEAAAHPVEAALFLPSAHAKRGQTLEAKLRLRIKDGWHLNSTVPRDRDLIPTSLTLAGDFPALAGALSAPKGRDVKFGFSEQPLSVYEGEILLSLPLTVKADAAKGKHALVLRLRFQACDSEKCLAPKDLDLRAEMGVE